MSDLNESQLALFVTALPEPPELSAQDRAMLARKIGQSISSAREKWPEVSLPEDIFLPYLAERLPVEQQESLGIVEAIADCNLRDLFLSCACFHKDEGAMRCFDREYGTLIRKSLASMRDVGSLEDEVRQRLQEKLFLGRPAGSSGVKTTGKPKIGSYNGRGALRGWIRAAAVREAINVLKSNHREVLGTDDFMAEMPAHTDDPEMAHMKELYRDEFKKAFEAAFSQLESRDRTLLRYKYSDAATLDEIAAIFQVHRATAARWLATVRQTLFTETKKRMSAELQVSDSEFESIMRAIQSNLDVSIEGHLEDSQ